MILDDLPTTLRPTVHVIDDWVTNRKLGLLFEGKIGAGKIIVCSIDLEHDLNTDFVRQQFRYSLLRYMAGPQFNPNNNLTVAQLRPLVSEPGRANR